MDFFKSTWPRAFFIAAAAQSVVCLVFESYVFAKFSLALNPIPANPIPELVTQTRTIPTFLALFIFAFLYELVLVWDALRMKNTIQVIGICFANLAFLVYTAIQIDQIQNAVATLLGLHAFKTDDPWPDLRGFLLAIPCVIAVTTVALSFIAWKLYLEFAWDILKVIGADLAMKRRFLHYQIYIALLKFDFFFFLGFTVQFIVIVNARTDVELYLTIAAIPVTIAILLLAAFFTRRENKVGMVCIIVLYIGALVYFIFKLARIYQPFFRDSYKPVQRSLTAFAVLTIILIALTITNAIICMRNFGKGLQKHLRPASRDEEKTNEQNAYNLADMNKPLPSRMTID